MKRCKTPGFSLAACRRERQSRERMEKTVAADVEGRFSTLKRAGAVTINPNVTVLDDMDLKDFDATDSARSYLRRVIRGLKDRCRAAGRQYRFATDADGVVCFAIVRR